MKRIVLIGTLGLILTAGAFAATSTGTLTLTGTVPQTVSITINPLTAATALPLQTTETDLPVASIVAKTNDANGFAVTVTSANGSKLVGTSASDSLAYTIDTSSSSTGGTYTPADLTGGSAIFSQTSRTTGTGVTQYLFINYTGDPSLNNGVNYTDTLTFTITGN